jgi:hypothetical protein
MVLTSFKSPTGVEASVAHLWNDGGWFPKGISGFFAGFQIAVFAFVGIELVGTTAAETKDPEKSLPRAINSIPIRIIMFYVFALIVIMSVTPWSSVVPDKSPFVELFVLVGLPAAASIINFVVLTSAASSANSGVFSTSRMLFGLAQDGVAPKAFGKLSKRAVPAKGLTFSCICLLGGVVMLYVNPSAIAAFTMITTVSAILFMFVWTIILCSYLVYRKQRPQLHEASIYKMPLGKVMCWVCMAFFVFVLVLLTLEEDTRQALIVTPIWFIVLGAGWLIVGKKRLAGMRCASIRRPGIGMKIKKSRAGGSKDFHESGALGRLCLFSSEGTRKQNVVFQTDVFHQVVDQFIDTVIHCFPGGAGFRRRRHAIGNVFDHFQQFACIIMLAFHHADWPHRLAAHSLFNHREQDALFFHHVAGKLVVQHGQVFG